MEVSWYCWVTVMSLVTNFHGCLCWPTLQPPLRPVTSKHELDSDESRKVLGSSVVTSVSVIMDHGNGTKTFLTDGIENPELKTNVIGSPGNLLNPDRYEFYTFDETGDLVKRLMTWDEIQGLIAGGDGDSLLGEASVPMYYSDLPEKVSPTHLTANDFQTSDIQGVHKVVESVQNVLKSELAASQSKIPPVAKPELLSNAPDWSLFLPSLLDNAEDGSELSSLGILASPSTSSKPTKPAQTTSTQEHTINLTSTEATKANLSEAISTTVKEFIKKTEKPNRFKVTTSKPSVPSKSPFNPPSKTSSYSTTDRWASSPFKKPYNVTKHGVSSSSEDRWTSTSPTTPKKTFTSSKYGGYATSDEHSSTTVIPPWRRNSTTKYGGYSSVEENTSTREPTTREPPTTRKTYTTSKYGSQSTTNELFSSIASVLQQVTDDGRPPTSPSTGNTTSTLQYKTSTESTPASTFDKIISMSQFKTTVEPTKHSSHSSHSSYSPLYTKINGFPNRPYTEFTRSTTESPYKTASSTTEKRYASSSPAFENKYTSYQYRPITDSTKLSSTTERTSPFSAYRPSFLTHKGPGVSDTQKTTSTSTFVDTHRPPSSFSAGQKPQISTSLTPVQFKPTTEPTRYTFSSSSLHTSPSTVSNFSRPTSQDGMLSSTSRSPDSTAFRYNLTGETSSVFTSPFKDTAKTTKTYESSTLASIYTPSKYHTYATKPTKNKISYTKYPPKPDTVFTSSSSKFASTASTASEKPLIRISTLRSSIDQTTTKPEPFVTWISTSPLEDPPSKVSLFGVFDSDKLVTEQYVSSSRDRHPSVSEFFRNTTAATSTTPSTPTTTTREPTSVSVLTELYTDIRHSIKQTLKPFSSSTYSRFPTTSIKNALSSISDVTRPFRPSERPDTIEAKTESTYHHSPFSKFSTPMFESTADTSKTTSSSHGVVASSPIVELNHSFPEMVMQRIPTLNPPNKLTTGSSSKATTKPAQYLFTEAMKNITQIAVMMNKPNETVTKYPIKHEYRNKVTHPTYETTKPLNAVFINDCITSLLSSGTLNATESATAEHSHIHYYKLPATDQNKENSLIYFYKLPPVVTTTQESTFASRPTEGLPTLLDPDVQYYKPELTDSGNSSVKSSTTSTIADTEYQKVTTAHRPSTSDSIIQDGISAVTNVLLQTESRIPNKEFTEFESPQNTTRVSYYTTESIMRTDEMELSAKNNTKISQPIVVIDEQTTAAMTTAHKPENRTASVQTIASLPTTASDNTTEFVDTTSVDSETTERMNNETDSAEVTTTEIVTENDAASSVASTTIVVSDFRNEYLDERNATVGDREENTTRKNHTTTTSSTSTTNSTSGTTASAKIPTTTATTVVTTTLKPITDKPTTSKPSAIIEKVDVTKTTANNNRSTIANVSSSTPPTEYVEVKLENKTKSNPPPEPSEDVPPQSAFRSPSPAQHRPLSSTVGPNVELHPAPHESMGLEASIAYLGDDVKRFVDFCNELSFKIWTSQTGKNLMTSRSIVLSPFAVLSALAMIFLGARGSSNGIMNDFLKLDDMVTFNPHQVFQNISESASNPKNFGVANTALVRQVFSDKSKGKVLDFYKERLQQYYDTHVEEINFNSIGDLIRKRTNLLVKRQTQGRIPDYLKGTALVMKPPLAILTANIFQTDCDLASTDGRDGEMYFVVRPSARQRRLVPIPAVVYRSGFLAGYEPGLDATAVTLNPESTVSTILVLPGQQGQVAPGDGLARLEQRLLESSYRRGAWSRLLRSLLFRPGLELQIPRFSHRSVLNLTTGLQKMGLEGIFSPDQADLRGINGLSNELHLSDIVQVNLFTTCGENTLGARHHTETYPPSPQRIARTNDGIFDRTYLDDSVNNYYSSLPLNLRPRQARLPDNPRLRFDRPFLYIVRHNPTGMILYIGRFNPRLLP